MYKQPNSRKFHLWVFNKHCLKSHMSYNFFRHYRKFPALSEKNHITFLPRWIFPILLEVPDIVGQKYSRKTSYDSKKVIWLFHHHMTFSDNENEKVIAEIFCMDELRFLSNFLWWEAIISDFLKSYLTIKRRSRNLSSVHSHR